MLQRVMREGNREEGHVRAGLAGLVAAAGAIVLAVGAANDSGVTAVTGGIVLAVAMLAQQVLHHRDVDYELFRRSEGK